MSETRTDVERQAFAAGVAVGVERAVTAYAPLVPIPGEGDRCLRCGRLLEVSVCG